MTVKENAIRLIQDLPENVSMDAIMEELFFKTQVDVGLRELDEGKGIPQEQVEERLSRWLTK